jgi:hypothetical protein
MHVAVAFPLNDVIPHIATRGPENFQASGSANQRGPLQNKRRNANAERQT